MPVYLRKKASFTPSSQGQADPVDDGDDMEDYIQDPDLVRDRLPQPFRMIDKIVEGIVGDSWDIISSRRGERLEEAAKGEVRAPRYECGIQMKSHGNACTMHGTPDGKYIIIGLTDGLAVVAAHNQETVAVWKDDKLELNTVQISSLDEHSYMIATVDDMGAGRLFAVCEEQIFLLHTFNEQEGEKKVLVGKCEASPCANYVGVCLESSHESWLEVHKAPKDAWLTEVGSASRAGARRDVTKSSTPQIDDDVTDHEVISEPTGTEEPAVMSLEDPEQQSLSIRSMTGSPATRDDRSSRKFSALSLVLRVRPSPAVTGIQYSTPQQLAKTVDSTGDVIGTGSNHLISPQHLELRNALFEQLHQQLLQYKPADNGSDSEQPLPQASFHFLSPGRMLPLGLDHTSLTPTGVPSTICVWWTGQTQLMHYSLIKTAKDVEHKPDIIWPQSSMIVASAVTPCTSLLALALQNNNVVIWDKHTGTLRRVVHMTEEAPITSLSFLDPIISPKTDTACSPYSPSAPCKVMVVCGTGPMFLVGCGLNDFSEPEAISLCKEEIERPVLVQSVPGMQQLILTCLQNGQIFLQDLKDHGRKLCQVALPQSHDLASPWQPIIAMGANGEMLYIKGTPNQSPREQVALGTEEGGGFAMQALETSLFVFQLRSFPTLDMHRADTAHSALPYVMHTTVEERAEALLRYRISQQPERQSRLQSNWSQLKDELTIIQQRGEELTRKTNKASFREELTRRLSISQENIFKT